MDVDTSVVGANLIVCGWVLGYVESKGGGVEVTVLDASVELPDLWLRLLTTAVPTILPTAAPTAEVTAVLANEGPSVPEETGEG